MLHPADPVRPAPHTPPERSCATSLSDADTYEAGDVVVDTAALLGYIVNSSPFSEDVNLVGRLRRRHEEIVDAIMNGFDSATFADDNALSIFTDPPHTNLPRPASYTPYTNFSANGGPPQAASSAETDTTSAEPATTVDHNEVSQTSTQGRLSYGGVAEGPPPCSVSRGTSKGKVRKSAKRTRAPARAWTEEEHERFKESLELYGRNWNRCAAHIGTRRPQLVRSHAQKYLIKLWKLGLPLPKKMQESGGGYTLSGKPLLAESASAKTYLTKLPCPPSAAAQLSDS